MTPGSVRAGLDAFVRRHPVVRAVAGAVVDRLVAVAHVPPPGLRAGRLLAGGGDAVAADRWPAVLVLLLGASEDVVATSVRDLSLVGALAGGLRPVLVLDRPHFAVARRAGLPVEHVVGREDWARRHPAGTWGDHLAADLAGLRHAYSATATVLLPTDGTAGVDLEALSVLLTPAPVGPLRATWTNGVRRLARGLDAPVA